MKQGVFLELNEASIYAQVQKFIWEVDVGGSSQKKERKKLEGKEIYLCIVMYWFKVPSWTLIFITNPENLYEVL